MLLPDPIVARERYRKSLRTLDRWDRDRTLGFPRPVYVRGRKHRVEAELDEFDRQQADKRQVA